VKIVLEGRTAHASMPEIGVSPMAAVAALMPALTRLTRPGPIGGDFSVAPGRAEVWATLRPLTDARMERLRAEAEALAGLRPRSVNLLRRRLCPL
jgi:metal-dependent amidase/aminoacylase/carboxypeptidase family protein